ncbi:ATP-binding protein [Streptomyces sp. BV129]|uniref:ATP-binding protein n=1 Tax=Streptomyces sp. BV129 TaxID=2849671 RepID=UPI001C2EE88F|nr:ATP-binding protein [Streptomyces sp. BV129]MBV1949925.1 ATP-binding protein [Streptomyces sp. BV129]
MPQPTTRARPTGHPGYSETLPREPESAATARRLVRSALAAWGLDDLTDDAILIVSELVTNAVLHARRESIRVVVERKTPGTVRVAVADFSRTLPDPCTPRDDDEDGRGLTLIAALAANWGTDERRWGKVVWAELEGCGD